MSLSLFTAFMIMGKRAMRVKHVLKYKDELIHLNHFIMRHNLSKVACPPYSLLMPAELLAPLVMS